MAARTWGGSRGLLITDATGRARAKVRSGAEQGDGFELVATRSKETAKKTTRPVSVFGGGGGSTGRL